MAEDPSVYRTEMAWSRQFVLGDAQVPGAQGGWRTVAWMSTSAVSAAMLAATVAAGKQVVGTSE